MRTAQHRLWFAALAAALLAIPTRSGVANAPPPNAGTVVLLHGLARSAKSWHAMESELAQDGYRVCNVNYPSREFSVEQLTERYVVPAVKVCAGDAPVHFVTHSLGGIVVRQIGASHPEIKIDRVVMLGPPNGGSEVVDKLSGLSLFKLINGPAGLQLGTDANSLPHTLAPPKAQVGVIAGRRTINPILSLLIPGQDDGKVSVANAQLAGMSDFVVLAASHPFLMTNPTVIAETKHFLHYGAFFAPK